MKMGGRDGIKSSYNKGVVSQVFLLQSHVNRILTARYNQAAGPVDGIFGPLTKQGVQRLQTVLQNDLNLNLGPTGIDGVVGMFTKAAINNSCGNLIH